MKKIQVNNQNVLGTVSEEAIKALNPAAADAIEKLDKGTGAGNDFLGWVKLPGEMPEALLDEINDAAKAFDGCEKTETGPDYHQHIGCKQKLCICPIKSRSDMNYHKNHQSDYRQRHHCGEEYTKHFISHNTYD